MLAKELGIVRSGAGQIEQRVRTRLHRFLQTDEALPVRWRVETVRRTIGTAMEEGTANQILDLDPDAKPSRGVILDLAGPYRSDYGWLVSVEAAAFDPTEEILRCADQVGRLNERLAYSLLRKWGLEPERHRGYITRDGMVREWKGRLVLWGKNIQGRVALALTDLGRPTPRRRSPTGSGRETSVACGAGSSKTPGSSGPGRKRGDSGPGDAPNTWASPVIWHTYWPTGERCPGRSCSGSW